MTTFNVKRFIFLAAFLLAACSPQSEREREYFRQKEAEKMEEETLKLTIMESAKDTDVILMVKKAPAREGNIDTDTWVDKQIADVKGQVIFPRWEVTRRGSSKYEARYLYTLLDDQNKMTKRGWRWDVDVVVKMVSAPRDFVEEDSQPVQVRKPEAEQRMRRIREEERSLE